MRETPRKRLTAPVGTAPAMLIEAEGVAVHALPPAARFSLRLREADAGIGGAEAAFRIDQAINRFALEGPLLSARLGPDEWLLIGPEDPAASLAGSLAAALTGRIHSMVDIGHRNAAFAVSGRRAPETINSGCALDLAADAFPTGMATRTLLGRAEVILMRLDDAPTYRIECWRSFAEYVGRWLTEAAETVEPLA